MSLRRPRIAIEEDAYQMLQRAVLERFGRVHGALGREASIAIRKHAAALGTPKETSP